MRRSRRVYAIFARKLATAIDSAKRRRVYKMVYMQTYIVFGKDLWFLALSSGHMVPVTTSFVFFLEHVLELLPLRLLITWKEKFETGNPFKRTCSIYLYHSTEFGFFLLGFVVHYFPNFVSER